MRATPAQYLRWRRAADLAGLSLSAWVERWLDELAGRYPRVLDALFKFAPKYGGQMPLENLQAVLYRRWHWDEADVDRALERLAQEEMVILFEEDWPTWSAFPTTGLRGREGRRITHVGLPPSSTDRPRRGRRD